MAFNLPLSKLSIGNAGVTGRVTLFLTTGMLVAIFRKIRVELEVSQAA